MKCKTVSLRICILWGLTIIAAALMIISFSLPWWTAQVSPVRGGSASIQIYGYGLRHNMVELRSYIKADETPLYQTLLAWAYLATNVGLILGNLRIKYSKSKWLLGSIGFIYIVYATVAIFLVIAHRTSELGISLQGMSRYGTGLALAFIRTSLQSGYYLTYVAGGMCLVIALFHGKLRATL